MVRLSKESALAWFGFVFLLLAVQQGVEAYGSGELFLWFKTIGSFSLSVCGLLFSLMLTAKRRRNKPVSEIRVLNSTQKSYRAGY